MSTDTDRFSERLANVEGTVEQMDKRIDDLSTRMDERFNTLESRMDTLDTKIERNRREMRRLLLVFIGGATVILTIVQVVIALGL